MVVAFLGCQATEAQRAGEVSYAEARYELSTSPAKVVLQVLTTAGLSARGHSMTVDGDGRVDLQRVFNGQQVVGEHQIQLETAAFQNLLDTALGHGLAEWEDSTIQAWMRQRDPRIPWVSDGLRVRVSLHLETYERGPIVQAPLDVSFTTKSPRYFAEWYPDIKQFQGVAELVEWLEARWDEAEGSAK